MKQSDHEGAGTHEANGAIDFEHADFGEAEVRTTGSLSCSICEAPISDTYFTRDGALVCARCEGPARAAGPGGSRAGRFFRAMAVGTVAAALASGMWMAVTMLTGYEIGLIAVAVGWIVGVAVQVGNRGVGGRPYQCLAVFLAYSAIVMTYVPFVADELQGGMMKGEESIEEQALAAEGAAEPSPYPTEPGELSVTSEEGVASTALGDEEQISEEVATLAAWVFAVPLAYLVPFLSGFENIIGILIIGFALYQAWKMTARKKIRWSGPFQVGSGPSV